MNKALGVAIALAILNFFFLNSILEISSIDICFNIGGWANTHIGTCMWKSELLGVLVEVRSLLFLLLHCILQASLPCASGPFSCF